MLPRKSLRPSSAFAGDRSQTGEAGFERSQCGYGYVSRTNVYPGAVFRAFASTNAASMPFKMSPPTKPGTTLKPIRISIRAASTPVTRKLSGDPNTLIRLAKNRENRNAKEKNVSSAKKMLKRSLARAVEDGIVFRRICGFSFQFNV